MKKLLNRQIAIVAVAVIATVAFFSFKSGDDRNFQIAKNLDIFNAIVKELDMFYVDTIDPNKTIREGIDNMLYTLDPYTEYFPEEDQSELEQMIKGSFGGMGSYIAYNTKLKRSMISEPFEGTPAAKAGLKAGDILMEIDGQDLAGKNNAEVSQMLRGQAGTSFKLKIERPNEKGGRTPMEFTIVRESIQNPAIPYTAVLDNNVGYISLSTFSGNPSKEFKKAFLDLKKQGATSLVIDLRSNGGGLLDEAVEIANYFLPRGKVIVTTKGKIKQASNTYKTLREPLDLDIPIAVLVNSGTASASEILSGSLQDLDRAVIVGNRTFGKGLVQQPIDFSDGSAIRLTIARYYTPSGRCIQRPYESGKDKNYELDIYNRYEHGEFFSRDSIKQNENERYLTSLGRTVYGGGGIMPDVFVPQDTTGVTSYLSSVINRGLTLQFTFQYTDNNRKKLSQYETEEDLLNYLRHQGLVEQFIRFADSKGVKRRNILIQKSYKRLEANIYGNIIYNMLGLEAYLKYFNKSDATVQQGIELLEKGEAFPKAPAETEEEVTKDNKDGKKKRTAQAYGITEDPTRIFDFAEASIS